MVIRFDFWPLVFAGLLVAVGAGPVHAQQTIDEARSEPLGTTVTVEGTVTRAYGAFARLQDASGPTGASAIVIRQTSGTNSSAFQSAIAEGTIQPGTTLRVTGTTSAFYGLVQINGEDLDSYEVQGQGSPPSPQSVTLSTLRQNGEDYESELLRVDGLRFSGASGTFQNETTYTVEGGDGTSLEFRVQDTTETALGGAPVPQGTFAYEGVLGQFHGQAAEDNLPNDGYQFIPVLESDLQPTRSFSFGRLFALAEEGDGSVSVEVRAYETNGAEVTVTAQVYGSSTAANGTDVSGFTSPTTLTFSGSDPAPKTLTLTPEADSEPEGVERLVVSLSSDDGAIANPSRFTLWILDAPAAQAPVAAGDSGSALLESLRQSYGDPPTLGYDRARDTLYRRVYNRNGSVETIYSGLQVSVDPEGGDASQQALDQDVNTEHLWPRSQGAGEEPAFSNMYILAPAWSEANGYRCNYPYAEINDADAERWIRDRQVLSEAPSTDRDTYTESVGNACGSPSENGGFEPRHSVKGDVARAVFYFMMAYPNRASYAFFEAQRETLLDWHRQDPVDAPEMRRTILQASYQGNKLNPFVLDSTLAARAYAEEGVQAGEVLTLQEARTRGGGRSVTVRGTVTRAGTEGGVYLQDDTGGLYVFGTSGSFRQAIGETIRTGARLEVTGTLQYYNGLLELTDVGGYEVLSQDNAVPPATSLTLADIAEEGEDYEAELVRVENVAIEADGDDTFQAGGSEGNYTIHDGTGSLTLRIPGDSELAGAPIPRRASFEGPLSQFNGEGTGADQPDEGYQLAALDASDLTTLLPRETSIDVSRSFGDPGTADSYRLVALPGQVDRPLASTLSGEQGIDWQAYWDNGSTQDFFVSFDGSDQFRFRPGRGFWLLGTSEWSVEATVSSIAVEGDGVSIPLHDGWNIISNPLPSGVAWDDVEASNGGSLQALWRWENGQFQQASAFASAANGAAFYFLNDQGLDELSIPLTAPSESTARRAESGRMVRAVEIAAQRGDEAEASVRVGEHADASAGRDALDLVAPPSRFADLAVHARSSFEDEDARQQRLAREVRSTGAPGQAYTLALRADTTGPVTLHARSLPRTGSANVVLLHPTTGRAHNLRTDGPMTLTVGDDPTHLRLLVGTDAYVRDEVSEQLPETLTVQPPAPNPFRDQTMLRYALPEAQHVRVEVYDLLGRRVGTLVDRRQEAGFHRAIWEGRSGGRRSLASGTYLVRWTAGGEQHVEQVVLVR